jgi:hypothetical protein
MFIWVQPSPACINETSVALNTVYLQNASGQNILQGIYNYSSQYLTYYFSKLLGGSSFMAAQSTPTSGITINNAVVPMAGICPIPLGTIDPAKALFENAHECSAYLLTPSNLTTLCITPAQTQGACTITVFALINTTLTLDSEGTLSEIST